MAPRASTSSNFRAGASPRFAASQHWSGYDAPGRGDGWIGVEVPQNRERPSTQLKPLTMAEPNVVLRGARELLRAR